MTAVAPCSAFSSLFKHCCPLCMVKHKDLGKSWPLVNVRGEVLSRPLKMGRALPVAGLPLPMKFQVTVFFPVCQTHKGYLCSICSIMCISLCVEPLALWKVKTKSAAGLSGCPPQAEGRTCSVMACADEVLTVTKRFLADQSSPGL